jgi:uncharacterized protein YndB with AHSA1/START domain
MQTTEHPLKITLSRVFEAPRALVFDAWTKPEHLVRWAAPHGFTIAEANGELRVGGAWRSVMVKPDGEPCPVRGEYREVVPNERLVFTHIWEEDDGTPEHETVVTVSFSDEAGGTRVTFEQSGFKSPASQAGHADGWTQCLDRLTELLAEAPGTVVVERTFAAPVALVWQALTDPARMKEWYFDVSEFRAEVGNEFRFAVEHEGNVFDHRCRVTRVEPERLLAYTWRYEGHPGESLVTFTFLPDGGGTRLRVTHTGLDTFPATSQFARENFRQGWTSLLGTSLKEFLEANSTHANSDQK